MYIFLDKEIAKKKNDFYPWTACDYFLFHPTGGYEMNNFFRLAQEVMLSRKQAKSVQPDLVFNNTPVHQTHFQKHLEVYLDIKLNFKPHIEGKISKAMTGTCIIYY